MAQFVPALKDLAEGRVEREGWLAWWAEHADAVERACPRGWFLGLKPRQVDQLPSDVMIGSQSGAGYILKQLNVPYQPSMRWIEQHRAEFDAYLKETKRLEREKAKRFAPAIARITETFPKFGAFLKRRAKDLVEEIEPPITDEQLAELQREAGGTLPGTYVRLLRCCAGIWLERLDLRSHNVLVHKSQPDVTLPTHGFLCFGEYSLEADGDQVLFDQKTLGDDDPPVFYYAHEVPEVRQLAPRFSEWVEALPRSPVFRS